MNEAVMKAFGLGEMVELKAAGKCPFCKKPVDHTPFKTELNEREAEISGMCQDCQDEFLGKVTII